jgi:teichuronic acid biosynthesis glycosyltransferase TuaC
MKLLTFTSLYPDSTRPRHGIFVETRLRRLVASGKVQSVVIAPVPWFPWRHGMFRSYASYARVPVEEVRHGIRVIHPRYPLVPRLGMSLAPFFMAGFVFRIANRLRAQGYDFDIIDAHYFYPDGVAAALVGRILRKPVVISARGSDINTIAQHYVPKKLIRYAARRARHVVAVSRALRDRLIALGVDRENISVLRNGVDTELFRPQPRDVTEERLDWDGQVLLAVGNLVPLKGHDLAIASLAYLPRSLLIIVGEGPERAALETQARRAKVWDRVKIVAPVDQTVLCDYYNMADILVLASREEGWPNVLLEAMACGTPVVASRAGGTAEIIRAPEAGRLFAPRSPRALAEAVTELTANYPDRSATRRYAQRFEWHEVTEAQIAMYQRVIAPDV